MYKKVLLFFLVSGIFQLLIFSCCDDTVSYHTKIEKIEAKCLEFHDELNDSSIVDAEFFSIGLDFEIDRISALFHPGELVSGLYAFQCPEDIHLGLKNEVRDISIKCSGDFLGIPAGRAIPNNLFRFHHGDELMFEGDVETYGIFADEWLELMNDGTGHYSVYYHRYIRFEGDPVSTEYLSFEITLTFYDRSVLKVNTNYIKIR